jgi:CRP-like cAMP-binding protein
VSTPNLERTLGEHSFFRGLSSGQITVLAGCASTAAFAAGDIILREGEAADRFHVIRQGRVGLEVAPPAGAPVTVETLENGEVLGWSWLFPPYKAHFDARALSAVRTLTLDGACLRRRCEEDKALGYELVRRFAELVVRRLEATRVQLLDIYGHPR